MKKKIYWVVLILISIIVLAKITIEVVTYYYENTSREKVLVCSDQERQETSVEKYITKVPIHFKKDCLEIGGKWGKIDCEYDEEERCFLNNKKSCLKAGGEWECTGGMACGDIFTANFNCTFPYIDGGKECSDGSECLGRWCEASETDISLYSKEAGQKENSLIKKDLKGTCIKEKGHSLTRYNIEQGSIPSLMPDYIE